MKTLICAAIAATALLANVCYAGPLYVAEGYFVVDNKAVDTYVREIPGSDSYENKRTQALVAIQEDVYYILDQVNKLLSSLRPYGLNIEARIRNLDLLSTNLFPDAVVQSGNVITDSYALKYFSDHLITQGAYANFKYDFALLWTGYNIFGPSGLYTTNIARVGTICNEKLATAVVESNATYITTLVTAQAFVSLLGASFDGAASDNIMAPANDPADKNRWSFSQCTATDILQFIPSVNPNCLLETSSASIKPTSSYATYKGKILDHNTVCKRYINDPRSYTCKSSNLYNNQVPKGDAICQQLFCRLPGTVYCTQTFSSDGLICDNRKRCDKGKCVDDSSAASANVDTNCVLGDEQVLYLPNFPFSGSCQQFIDQETSSMCYNGNINNSCCATCKKYKTGPSGCEYGDQNKMCAELALSTSCAPQNRAVCCYTCRNNVGKRSTDEDRLVPTLDDDSHKKAHKLDGYKANSDGFFKHHSG